MLVVYLTLTAAFAILTWSDLHKGLFLLVAVLPSYLLRTEIFGFPTTLLELLVITFLVIWLIKRGHEQWFSIKLSATHLLPLLIVTVATVSLFVAPDRLAALGIWKAYFFEPILLFFVLKYELSQGGFSGSRLFQSLSLCALVLSLIVIFQWLTGMGIPIPWDIERRVTSVFDYPNALGLFLGPIVVIAVLHLCHPERAKRAEGSQVSPSSRSLHFARLWPGFGRDDKKLFWFMVTVLSITAIILAQSEAAIVSIVATLLITGFLNQKTRIFSSSFLVLFVFFVFLFPPLLTKLILQDYSGSVRLSQWSETIDMLRDHWFFGAGLSGYPTVFEPYHQATHFEIFQYPHNIILNIWVELGLLGLVGFGWLIYSVLSSLRGDPSKGSTKQSSKIASLTSVARNDGMIAFFALLQMTVHGLVDV
ncbi:O-antigen ligase family protein, partial [Candidatus Uhrbacteria bacterium]|nr:O-antigen ligase family protein [Candidatus Uhrbacteria bacterium]